MNFSFEFFPARTAQAKAQLQQTARQLSICHADFFSVTYGALGSERGQSWDTTCQLQQVQPAVPVAAHLTAAGQSRAEVKAYAARLAKQGIKRLVVLRGDAPLKADGFQSVAEMISSLLEVADFDISVAAYPEVHPKAQSARHDLQVLKQKLDAGAARALTQYFFAAEDFLRFREQATALGINKPVVPGILPVHDFAKVCDFSQRCGARIPDALAGQFSSQMSLAEQQKVGLEWVLRLCETLQEEGAGHFHFYTLNRADLSLALIAGLQPVLPGEYRDNAVLQAA